MGAGVDEKTWLPNWTLIDERRDVPIDPAIVCGAPRFFPMTGTHQRLQNGATVISVFAVDDHHPISVQKAIYSACLESNPDVYSTPKLMWSSRDSAGTAARSILDARNNQAEVAYIVTATTSAAASGAADLLMLAYELHDNVQAAMTADRPAWTREQTPGLAEIPVELMRTMTHRPLTVILAGKVWNKTVAVLHKDTTGRPETAASVWTSTDGRPFEQVHDFMTYDFGCLAEDSVCRALLESRSGLGFVALLEQHPSGRVALLVRVPTGRSARVLTAEGGALPVLDAVDGSVMQLTTEQPWKVRVLVKTAGGTEYQLPLAVGGVIWVT